MSLQRNHGHRPLTHGHSLYQHSHIIQRDVMLANGIFVVSWDPDAGQGQVS